MFFSYVSFSFFAISTHRGRDTDGQDIRKPFKIFRKTNKNVVCEANSVAGMQVRTFVQAIM